MEALVTMKRAPLKTRPRSAFTLVELLTAVVLLVMLAASVFVILGQAMRTTGLGKAYVQCTRNAHNALMMLAQDLEGAVLDERGYVFVCAVDGGANDVDGTKDGKVQIDTAVLTDGPGGAAVTIGNVMPGSQVLIFTTHSANRMDINQTWDDPDVTPDDYNYYADNPITVAYYVRGDGVLVRQIDRNRLTQYDSGGTAVNRDPDPRYFTQFDLVNSTDPLSAEINFDQGDYELARYINWDGSPGTGYPVGFFLTFAYRSSSVDNRFQDEFGYTGAGGTAWNSRTGAVGVQRNRLPLAVSIHLRLYDELAAQRGTDEETRQERTMNFHTVVRIPGAWRQYMVGSN